MAAGGRMSPTEKNRDEKTPLRIPAGTACSLSRLRGKEPLVALTRISPQMLLEELRRAAPGELGCLAVVHRQTLLDAEAMGGLVAEHLERVAGRLHALLEAIDQLRRAPIIPVGEMRLQRNPDVRGF